MNFLISITKQDPQFINQEIDIKLKKATIIQQIKISRSIWNNLKKKTKEWFQSMILVQYTKDNILLLSGYESPGIHYFFKNEQYFIYYYGQCVSVWINNEKQGIHIILCNEKWIEKCRYNKKSNIRFDQSMIKCHIAHQKVGTEPYNKQLHSDHPLPTTIIPYTYKKEPHVIQYNFGIFGDNDEMIRAFQMLLPLFDNDGQKLISVLDMVNYGITTQQKSDIWKHSTLIFISMCIFPFTHSGVVCWLRNNTFLLSMPLIWYHINRLSDDMKKIIKKNITSWKNDTYSRPTCKCCQISDMVEIILNELTQNPTTAPEPDDKLLIVGETLIELNNVINKFKANILNENQLQEAMKEEEIKHQTTKNLITQEKLLQDERNMAIESSAANPVNFSNGKPFPINNVSDSMSSITQEEQEAKNPNQSVDDNEFVVNFLTASKEIGIIKSPITQDEQEVKYLDESTDDKQFVLHYVADSQDDGMANSPTKKINDNNKQKSVAQLRQFWENVNTQSNGITRSEIDHEGSRKYLNNLMAKQKNNVIVDAFVPVNHDPKVNDNDKKKTEEDKKQQEGILVPFIPTEKQSILAPIDNNYTFYTNSYAKLMQIIPKNVQNELLVIYQHGNIILSSDIWNTMSFLLVKIIWKEKDLWLQCKTTDSTMCTYPDRSNIYWLKQICPIPNDTLLAMSVLKPMTNNWNYIDAHINFYQYLDHAITNFSYDLLTLIHNIDEKRILDVIHLYNVPKEKSEYESKTMKPLNADNFESNFQNLTLLYQKVIIYLSHLSNASDTIKILQERLFDRNKYIGDYHIAVCESIIHIVNKLYDKKIPVCQYEFTELIDITKTSNLQTTINELLDLYIHIDDYQILHSKLDIAFMQSSLLLPQYMDLLTHHPINSMSAKISFMKSWILYALFSMMTIMNIIDVCNNTDELEDILLFHMECRNIMTAGDIKQQYQHIWSQPHKYTINPAAQPYRTIRIIQGIKIIDQIIKSHTHLQSLIGQQTVLTPSIYWNIAKSIYDIENPDLFSHHKLLSESWEDKSIPFASNCLWQLKSLLDIQKEIDPQDITEHFSRSLKRQAIIDILKQSSLDFMQNVTLKSLPKYVRNEEDKVIYIQRVSKNMVKLLNQLQRIIFTIQNKIDIALCPSINQNGLHQKNQYILYFDMISRNIQIKIDELTKSNVDQDKKLLASMESRMLIRSQFNIGNNIQSKYVITKVIQEFTNEKLSPFFKDINTADHPYNTLNEIMKYLHLISYQNIDEMKLKKKTNLSRVFKTLKHIIIYMKISGLKYSLQENMIAKRERILPLIKNEDNEYATYFLFIDYLIEWILKAQITILHLWVANVRATKLITVPFVPDSHEVYIVLIDSVLDQITNYLEIYHPNDHMDKRQHLEDMLLIGQQMQIHQQPSPKPDMTIKYKKPHELKQIFQHNTGIYHMYLYELEHFTHDNIHALWDINSTKNVSTGSLPVYKLQLQNSTIIEYLYSIGFTYKNQHDDTTEDYGVLYSDMNPSVQTHHIIDTDNISHWLIGYQEILILHISYENEYCNIIVNNLMACNKLKQLTLSTNDSNIQDFTVNTHREPEILYNYKINKYIREKSLYMRAILPPTTFSDDIQWQYPSFPTFQHLDKYLLNYPTLKKRIQIASVSYSKAVLLLNQYFDHMQLMSISSIIECPLELIILISFGCDRVDNYLIQVCYFACQYIHNNLTSQMFSVIHDCQDDIHDGMVAVASLGLDNQLYRYWESLIQLNVIPPETSYYSTENFLSLLPSIWHQWLEYKHTHQQDFPTMVIQQRFTGDYTDEMTKNKQDQIVKDHRKSHEDYIKNMKYDNNNVVNKFIMLLSIATSCHPSLQPTIIHILQETNIQSAFAILWPRGVVSSKNIKLVIDIFTHPQINQFINYQHWSDSIKTFQNGPNNKVNMTFLKGVMLLFHNSGYPREVLAEIMNIDIKDLKRVELAYWDMLHDYEIITDEEARLINSMIIENISLDECNTKDQLNPDIKRLTNDLSQIIEHDKQPIQEIQLETFDNSSFVHYMDLLPALLQKDVDIAKDAIEYCQTLINQYAGIFDQSLQLKELKETNNRLFTELDTEKATILSRVSQSHSVDYLSLEEQESKDITEYVLQQQSDNKITKIMPIIPPQPKSKPAKVNTIINHDSSIFDSLVTIIDGDDIDNQVVNFLKKNKHILLVDIAMKILSIKQQYPKKKDKITKMIQAFNNNTKENNIQIYQDLDNNSEIPQQDNNNNKIETEKENVLDWSLYDATSKLTSPGAASNS